MTRRRLAAYLVALLSVCVPWMVFASFLLTEVAAYPAFLWAMLGAAARDGRAPAARPTCSRSLGIALATLARTQFSVLVLVLAPAIVARRSSRSPTRGRAGSTASASAAGAPSRGHRVLAVFYALLAVAAVVLAAAGRLSSTLGTYAEAVEGNTVPAPLRARRSPSTSR